MKRSIKSLVILLMLITSSVIFPKHTSAQQTNVSFQVFYDQLSPYGEWVDYPKYGYVWIPDTGSDFVPYSTEGHWVLTNYGWTWVSNYDWGWAPFHYGRWDYDNYYGWLWVPDNEWGPSWVNWRRAEGYYGWSPMEPGVSISVSFGSAYNSYNDHWLFVRDRDFERSDINHYYVNRTDHDRIVRKSTVINTTYIDNSRHTTYVSGPARADVQKVTGRKINPVAIRENSRPGQQLNNGQLQIYRPQVNKNNSKEFKPSRITNLKDVKRPSERKVSTQPNTARPQNNSKVQPAQQPKTATPAYNSGRQQQPKTARPQNNTKVQPVQQPRIATPAINSGRQQQPNNARPQNNTRVQPVQQPRIATPANNSGRQQQPNNVRPQNNTRVQPVQQPRIATPANNSGRQQQPNNARPQNNTRVQPVQQPRIATPANNSRRQQQPNTARPQNISKEQPKEPKPEQNK